MKATRDAQLHEMFEGTFFRLLELHNELVRDLVRQASSGRNVLVGLENELAGFYRSTVNEWRNGDEREHVLLAYDTFFDQRQLWIAHYFHATYHILVHIDRHADQDAIWYAKILRSHLSTPEIVLLLYYGLTTAGAKLKVLLERYGMLEDLPADRLLQPEHRSFYAATAYNAG